jgi:hypothetical protein
MTDGVAKALGGTLIGFLPSVELEDNGDNSSAQQPGAEFTDRQIGQPTQDRHGRNGFREKENCHADESSHESCEEELEFVELVE